MGATPLGDSWLQRLAWRKWPSRVWSYNCSSEDPKKKFGPKSNHDAVIYSNSWFSSFLTSSSSSRSALMHLAMKQNQPSGCKNQIWGGKRMPTRFAGHIQSFDGELGVGPSFTDLALHFNHFTEEAVLSDSMKSGKEIRLMLVGHGLRRSWAARETPWICHPKHLQGVCVSSMAKVKPLKNLTLQKITGTKFASS